MNDNEQILNSFPEQAAASTGMLTRLARRLVLKGLSAIKQGHLIVIDHEERLEFGDPLSGLCATVWVQDPRFFLKVAVGGTVGAAETYRDGLWRCSDLTALVRIMVRNQGTQRRLEGGVAHLAASLRRILHRLNDNSHRGSRRNIAAHYDLGNEFYQLLLDPTLAYSCAVFEGADSTLEEASRAKFDLICRKLQLAPGMKVLEIGTGWGGFAIHAAQNYHCLVTTTTISRQQHDLAAQRIKAAGLEGQVTLLQLDYRDLAGEFDRVVSIEMIEAVGHRHLATFFQACSERLKPDGAVLIQAITTPDHLYERYLAAPDFINCHIFPGSCCPSLTAMSEAAARGSDLRLVHLEDLTPHYPRTLRAWRAAFHANLERVRELGFDESFIRMWEYYLCYCEGGFAERFSGVLQLVFNKPQREQDPIQAAGPLREQP